MQKKKNIYRFCLPISFAWLRFCFYYSKGKTHSPTPSVCIMQTVPCLHNPADSDSVSAGNPLVLSLIHPPPFTMGNMDEWPRNRARDAQISFCHPAVVRTHHTYLRPTYAPYHRSYIGAPLNETDRFIITVKYIFCFV